MYIINDDMTHRNRYTWVRSCKAKLIHVFIPHAQDLTSLHTCLKIMLLCTGLNMGMGSATAKRLGNLYSWGFRSYTDGS